MRRRRARLRRRRLARHLPRQRHHARGFPKPARNRPIISTATKATARSRTSPRAPGSRRADGVRAPAPATTTTTADDDLFVTYWGQNRLYRNTGRRHVRRCDERCRADPAAQALGRGLRLPRLRPRRPARSRSPPTTSISICDRTPTPDRGLCRYKGMPVACGPPGLPGGKNVLYRNTRRRHVRGRLGAVGDHPRAAAPTGSASPRSTSTTTAGSIVYVANDSNPSALYRNNRNGTFTDIGVEAGCAYSQDGKPQAGMGIAIGDYDRDGTMDIFKTNFAGDTSTLYRNTGDRASARIDVRQRHRPQHALARVGRRVRRFRSPTAGSTCSSSTATSIPKSHESRPRPATSSARWSIATCGTAGSPMSPSTLGAPVTDAEGRARRRVRATSTTTATSTSWSTTSTTRPICSASIASGERHWIALKLVGKQSNRSAIGARIRLVTADGVQWQEVRGGGSYYSQNDLRVHFGLGGARAVERIEVRWPNGREELLERPRHRPLPHARRRIRTAGHVGRGEEMRMRRPCAIAIACLCLTTAAAASPVQDDVKAALVAARGLIDSGKPPRCHCGASRPRRERARSRVSARDRALSRRQLPGRHRAAVRRAR